MWGYPSSTYVTSHFEYTKYHIRGQYAWTDSLVVLSWLRGNPRQFKTFVGNRVSDTVELVSPGNWHHVNSSSNSADCASRSLFPKELIQHNEWWNGPKWLYENESHWPWEPVLIEYPESTEEWELHSEIVLMSTPSELPLLRQVSSYTRLKRESPLGYFISLALVQVA